MLNSNTFAELLDNSKLSTRCHKDFQDYLSSLMEFELWALQSKLSIFLTKKCVTQICYLVYDASAKVSPGILSGNVNNFGDFDECLQSRSSNSDTSGQYCLAYVKIDVPDELLHLNKLKKLSHSLETFKSNFTFDDVSYAARHLLTRLMSYRRIHSDILGLDACNT